MVGIEIARGIARKEKRAKDDTIYERFRTAGPERQPSRESGSAGIIHARQKKKSDSPALHSLFRLQWARFDRAVIWHHVTLAERIASVFFPFFIECVA